MTRAAARRAAVLGSPIGHSLSPILHRAAYTAMALPWSYDAIDCDEAALPGLLDGLDDAWIGLSLTMPLKRAVLPLLDDVTPLAREVGAVNTVIFEGGGRSRRRLGDNTDVAGVAGAIAAALADPAGSGPPTGGRVTILGAGGTAAAVIGAARELGVDRVEVVVRDAARAGGLLEAAERLGVGVDLVAWPGVAALASADVVVSTVPAGATDALAASQDWAPRPGQLVFDVLYHPWPTPLAAAAAAVGARVIGGLELLVRQAACQIGRWSGRPAPLAAMRAAGEAALAARAGGRSA